MVTMMELFQLNINGNMNKSNREEWLKKTLLSLQKGGRILDAGAGELQYKKFCSHLKYTSQDFAQYDGSGDGTGLQTKQWNHEGLDIVSDIIDMPVKNGSFDAVMCVEVLEHLPYPHLAIKEFSRVLKKGGKLILTAPFTSLTHYAPYHFSTGFNRYWYEKVLEDNGFKIEELSYNGNYFELIIQEIKRISSVETKYTDNALAKSFLYKFAKYIMIKSLSIMSKQDKGSSELGSFGIHVLAKKI